MAGDERASQDPVASFRFAVEIDGVVAGWFTECRGLSVERQVETYREGGQNAYVHQLPGRTKHQHVTLERGLVDAALWEWFAGDEGSHEGLVRPRDVTVILLNADKSEARRWNLARVLPRRWSGPQLRAEGRAVAVERLELAQDGALDTAVAQRSPDGSGEAIQRAEGLESGQASQPVDLPGLARKVFALLGREAWVERERAGWRR